MDPGTPRTGNVRVILHIEVGDVAFTLLHTAFVQSQASKVAPSQPVCGLQYHIL